MEFHKVCNDNFDPQVSHRAHRPWPFLNRDSYKLEEGGNDGKPQNNGKWDEQGSFAWEHESSSLVKVKWIRMTFPQRISHITRSIKYEWDRNGHKIWRWIHWHGWSKENYEDPSKLSLHRAPLSIIERCSYLTSGCIYATTTPATAFIGHAVHCSVLHECAAVISSICQYVLLF